MKSRREFLSDGLVASLYLSLVGLPVLTGCGSGGGGGSGNAGETPGETSNALQGGVLFGGGEILFAGGKILF